MLLKNKTLNLLIRIAILVASYLYIYFQLLAKDHLTDSWKYFTESISAGTLITGLIAVGLMMLLNWSVEAIKWRYLIRKTERISFWKAFRAVWAGVTVSTFTPNRVGEYFGRVFILKDTNPWQGAFMTVVGSLSQLLVTLVTGSFALVFFIIFHTSDEFNIPSSLLIIMIIVVLLMNAALIVLYFNVWFMEPLLKRFTKKRWTKLREHLKVFAAYSKKELLVTLLFSITRYAVFAMQFYFLMRLFMVPLPFWDGMMIIACIYFVMTAVPTIALTELGVRGSLVIFFLDLYFANNYLIGDTANIGAVAAASFVWLINLVIPALIGGLFVLQLKFIRK